MNINQYRRKNFDLLLICCSSQVASLKTLVEHLLAKFMSWGPKRLQPTCCLKTAILPQPSDYTHTCTCKLCQENERKFLLCMSPVICISIIIVTISASSPSRTPKKLKQPSYHDGGTSGVQVNRRRKTEEEEGEIVSDPSDSESRRSESRSRRYSSISNPEVEEKHEAAEQRGKSKNTAVGS